MTLWGRSRQPSGDRFIFCRLLRLLTRQVGELSQEMRDRSLALSLEQLENLGEALLDFQEMADKDVLVNSGKHLIGKCDLLGTGKSDRYNFQLDFKQKCVPTKKAEANANLLIIFYRYHLSIQLHK